MGGILDLSSVIGRKPQKDVSRKIQIGSLTGGTQKDLGRQKTRKDVNMVKMRKDVYIFRLFLKRQEVL